MGFVTFMASGFGRVLRIVAGLALVAVGLVGLGETTGTVVAAVGLVPLLAGMFDVCLFVPLFLAPVLGREVRARR